MQAIDPQEVLALEPVAHGLGLLDDELGFFELTLRDRQHGPAGGADVQEERQSHLASEAFEGLQILERFVDVAAGEKVEHGPAIYLKLVVNVTDLLGQSEDLVGEGQALL